MTIVHELELPEVDMMTLGREEMAARVAELQRDHWLAKHPFGYLVMRHEDVTSLLRDRRFHSAIAMLPAMSGLTEDNDEENFLTRRQRSILAVEGEEHSRLRRIVASAFTPKSADRLRPFMRSVVQGLIDEVRSSGRCELVADVCDPYPIPIICELLGAPKSDWKLFSHWATEIFKIFNGNLLEDMAAVTAAGDELDAYVRAMVAERRDDPRDDLLTDLIAAEAAGDRLDMDELVMMAEAVLMAGTDTTRNQLACCVALLSAHPDQWKLLAEDPSVAPTAVEETMRHLGTVRATMRIASEDIEYRGVTFPQGTLVATSLAGANMDPRAFDRPQDLDITRHHESVQMTFGSGIHFCLGAALARAELQEALPILAKAMPDMAIDGEIEWKPEMTGIWGPAKLPLRFTPS